MPFVGDTELKPLNLADISNAAQTFNLRKSADQRAQQDQQQQNTTFARQQQEWGKADSTDARNEAAVKLASAGDYAGAESQYGGLAGHLDTHQLIAGLQDQHRAQIRATYGAAVPVAIQALQEPDPQKRMALIQAAAPSLINAGWKPEQIAAFQPTDANLQGLISNARSAEEALKLYDAQQAKLNEPYTLGQDQQRYIGDKLIASGPESIKAITTPEGGTTTILGGAGHTGIGGAFSPVAHAYADALTKAGLPRNAVAGIIGNLHVESGFNPGATGDGGQAIGVAQWHPDRAAQFQSLFGVTPAQGSPAQVAQFIKIEIAALPAAQQKAILNAGSPAAAAAAFDRFYERSDGTTRQARAAAATQWASGGKPMTIHGQPKTPDAPSGYRFKPDGSLEAIPGGPANNAVLDQPTTALMADQYLSGDKSVLQNLGRGTQGAKNIVLLRQEILKQANQRGMSGADIATAMAQYNGLAASARTIGNIGGKVDYGTNELAASIPLAQKASQALPRGNWVPVNRVEQMIQSGTSSPQLRDFAVKTNAVINAYNLVAGRAGTSVAQREHNAELLRTADGPAAYNAALAAMQTEGQVAHNASRQTMSGIGTGHGQGNAQPPQAAVSMLRGNPALRGAFDAKYGAGAAARALGR